MKQRGNIIIILIIVAALAVGITLYNQSKSAKTPQPTPATNSTQTKTFKSSNVMKFTIQIPNRFTATEKLGSVTLKTNNDEILIGQNGTNFDSLKDYIKNSRNNLDTRLVDRKDLNINGLEATFGFINDEKIYLIYVENTVYLISSKSSSLYSDLDQIAKSFKYTP